MTELQLNVLPTSGRDASLVIEVLRAAAIDARLLDDPLSSIANAIEQPLGPLLIAEESLTPPLIEALRTLLENQPSWSDLPILILTSSGQETIDSRWRARERLPLGFPVLLERPIRAATLISSVHAALRTRERQYAMRLTLAERDRALRDLLQQQSTLQVILDSLPVGVVLSNLDGEMTYGNREIESILRRPVLPTQDAGARIQWTAFHPDGRSLLANEYPLARALSTGQPVLGEDLLCERGDGTAAWISVSAVPIRGQQQELRACIVTVVDIDGKRRATEALRRNADRFRRLVENSGVGVLIGDRVGGTSYMNRTLLERLGYAHADIAAGHVRWDQLTPPEFRERDEHALRELRQSGAAAPYEKALLTRDGGAIPFLVGASTLPDLSGEYGDDAIAVFLTDLSTQKKAEAALVQSEKLAAVGRLAASISHEINNPLEAVTNLLYLIRHEDLSPAGRNYLSLADQELARVSQIAGQTLRFHRQATRARPLTPQDLIEPVIALYQGRLNNSGIRLEFQHRGADPVTCFEGDIRQVLNNLVSNAIDAMRGGGRLLIRTANTRLWRSSIPGVRITIADTGHGIERATARRIFEPFYTTKGINGTGLGLWISLGIVEKHSGRLQVSSHTGKVHGTVFSLLLPTQLAPTAIAASPIGATTVA